MHPPTSPCPALSAVAEPISQGHCRKSHDEAESIMTTFGAMGPKGLSIVKYLIVSFLDVQFGTFDNVKHMRARTQRMHALGGHYWQFIIVCYSVLGVEQRHAGDRYRRTVKYGDNGLKFRDFSQADCNVEVTALFR